MQDRSTTIKLLLAICFDLLNTVINGIININNIFHTIPSAFFILVACFQLKKTQKNVHNSSPTTQVPQKKSWALLDPSEYELMYNEAFDIIDINEDTLIRQ